MVETLFALLHRDVPALARGTPAALPRLDLHLWRSGLLYKRARWWVDRVLASSIGAYVGNVMVAELRGRWLAGASARHAMVAIGDRAWQPFERARRLVRSHAAAIDYSMTKFYREAARYAPDGEEMPWNRAS